MDQVEILARQWIVNLHNIFPESISEEVIRVATQDFLIFLILSGF